MQQLTTYTDGACRVSNPGLCSSAFIVYRNWDSPGSGLELYRSGRALEGLNTNNVAEYTAVLDALEWADSKGVALHIHCDSQLVVQQVNGQWKVSKELLPLSSRAFLLLHKTGSSIKHIRGHNGELGNEAVDALCNEILDVHQGKKRINVTKEN